MEQDKKSCLVLTSIQIVHFKSSAKQSEHVTHRDQELTTYKSNLYDHRGLSVLFYGFSH